MLKQADKSYVSSIEEAFEGFADDVVNFVERKFKEDKNSGMAELAGAIRTNNLLIMKLIDTLSAPRRLIMEDGKPVGVTVDRT